MNNSYINGTFISFFNSALKSETDSNNKMPSIKPYISFVAWFLSMGITLLVMLGYPEHFMIEESLISSDKFHRDVYADVNDNGDSVSRWKNEARTVWQCDINYAIEYPYCILQIYIGDGVSRGMDLNNFNEIILDVNYKGNLQEMRMYMRNYNPAYSRYEDFNSKKYSKVEIPVGELRAPVSVKMSEFKVADWWLESMQVSREHRSAEYDNVVLLGLEVKPLKKAGHHEIQINDIRLRGTSISREQLYFYIIVFWASVFLAKLAYRFYELVHEVRRRDDTIKNLVDRKNQLSEEKREFESLSKMDQLTNVYNRFGIMKFMESLTEESSGRNRRYGVILIDVDNFKNLNDSCGHDVGDRVLAELAEHLSQGTRQTDCLGRWGGEEFILICPDASMDEARRLAEKLRGRVASIDFGIEDGRAVTISVGVSVTTLQNNFEIGIKQADEKLYAAKASGKNCVVA